MGNARKSILQIQNDFNQFRKRLPTIIATEAVNFFKLGFRKEAFIGDNGLEKWQPRKYPDANKKKRNILVKSGRLRRSVRPTLKTYNRVVIGTDVPYAPIHNQGGTYNVSQLVRSHSRKTKRGITKVKAHSRKRSATYPQRKFIGQSKALDKRLNRQVKKRLKAIF